MPNDLTLQLSQISSPFLSGFGRFCLEQGMSDADTYRNLSKAAAAFPAVAGEIAEFQKRALEIGLPSGGLGAGAAAGIKAIGAGPGVPAVLPKLPEPIPTTPKIPEPIPTTPKLPASPGMPSGGPVAAAGAELKPPGASPGLPSGGLGAGAAAGIKAIGAGPGVPVETPTTPELPAAPPSEPPPSEPPPPAMPETGPEPGAEAGAGTESPAAFSQDPSQLYQQLQNPDAREAYQSQLQQQESSLLSQAKAGTVSAAAAKSIATNHVINTAATQGIKPAQLVNNIESTVADVQTNGITPATANAFFKSPASKELTDTLMQSGDVHTPQDLMSSLRDWIVNRPVDAGTVLLGGSLALGGLYSSMTGGGMGAFMAMLGGGAMVASGAGMFGEHGLGQMLGDHLGVKNQGQSLMNIFSRPAAAAAVSPLEADAPPQAGAAAVSPGASPVIASQPTAAKTMGGYYAEQAAKSGGPAELQRILKGNKQTEALATSVLKTPEAIQQFITAYQQNPVAAVASLRKQVPFGFGGAFDRAVPSIHQHLQMPAPPWQGPLQRPGAV
jgi:hypothetical protein